MKNLKLVLGVAAMVAMIGCSESTVDVASTQQDNGSNFRASGVPATYQSPLVLKKSGDMVQDKQLTVVDFTAEGAQLIDGLSSQGVSYTYSTAGYGWYGVGAAGTGDFYDGLMFLSDDGNGTLCITFDQPTDIVEFAVIISQTVAEAGGAIVDVYGPSGQLRGSYNVDLAPSPFWAGAWFSYTKNAVKSVCITKKSGTFASQYAVDNITFHQGEN